MHEENTQFLKQWNGEFLALPLLGRFDTIRWICKTGQGGDKLTIYGVLRIHRDTIPAAPEHSGQRLQRWTEYDI